MGTDIPGIIIIATTTIVRAGCIGATTATIGDIIDTMPVVDTAMAATAGTTTGTEPSINGIPRA